MGDLPRIILSIKIPKDFIYIYFKLEDSYTHYKNLEFWHKSFLAIIVPSMIKIVGILFFLLYVIPETNRYLRTSAAPSTDIIYQTKR